MTTPTNPSELFSPFLPTTFNIPEEDDRLKSFLNENFANFADVINDKSIGVITDQVENFSGGKWWYKNTKINRNEYQTIVYIPSLPNAGPLPITLTSDPAFPIENINPEFVITNLYGTASKPCSSIGAGDGDYFMYTNEGNAKITFTMSDTQLVLTSTVDLSGYSGFIFISYLRNGV